ncbi:MAG: MarR family transcriptional regulator [Planctomycetes bacterium]|nr:MarR family transcriptional regulator [Planctomycetota bacterium]
MEDRDCASFDAAVTNHLGVLIRRTEHHVHQYLNRLFTTAGLTLEQAMALTYVHRHKGCKQKALEQCMNTRSASVAVLVATLVTKGLILKCPNPTDARSTLLSLTPHGKRAAAKCRNILARADAVIASGFTADERADLERRLERVIHNVDTIAGDQEH